MTEYKIIKDKVGYPNQAITEDGHTMFIEHILYRLQTLDFLEKWKSNVVAEDKNFEAKIKERFMGIDIVEDSDISPNEVYLVDKNPQTTTKLKIKIKNIKE